MKKINILLIVIFLSGCSFFSKTPKQEYLLSNNQYNILEIKYRQMLSNKFTEKDIKKLQNQYEKLLEILEEINEHSNENKEKLPMELVKQLNNLKIETLYRIQILEDLKN